MPPASTNEQQKARDAVRRALGYLTSCGIHVPRFRLTSRWE